MVCYILTMKNNEQQKASPIFDIDPQEMGKLVDALVIQEKINHDEQIKSYIERLQAAEIAIRDTKENLKTLFDLHDKLGLTGRLGFRNPTSLYITTRSGIWAVQDKIKNPTVCITGNGHMYAVCKKTSFNSIRDQDIEFDSEYLMKEISRNGLCGNTMIHDDLKLDGGINYKELIENVETVVRTLPVYVAAFKKYLETKGK